MKIIRFLHILLLKIEKSLKLLKNNNLNVKFMFFEEKKIDFIKNLLMRYDFAQIAKNSTLYKRFFLQPF